MKETGKNRGIPADKFETSAKFFSQYKESFPFISKIFGKNSFIFPFFPFLFMRGKKEQTKIKKRKEFKINTREIVVEKKFPKLSIIKIFFPKLIEFLSVIYFGGGKFGRKKKIYIKMRKGLVVSKKILNFFFKKKIKVTFLSGGEFFYLNILF